MPDGAVYELVSGPSLCSDLFQWNGDGSFWIAPLAPGPSQVPFSYQVNVGGSIFGPVGVTVGVDRELLVDLPTFTDPMSGELAVNVPTLILGGRNFPLHQFRLANSPFDVCTPPHWHASLPVFSLEEPVENPLSDPDPPRCGFGIWAAVPQGSVMVDLDVWNAFVGLHPPL